MMLSYKAAIAKDRAASPGSAVRLSLGQGRDHSQTGLILVDKLLIRMMGTD